MLRTPAKVNLALEILGKREDGYHEISTVLQAIDLFDRLTVEDAADLSLATTDPALPVDDGNLVVRAARALGAAAGVRRGARIALDKRIPVAAGLGGGSSDAAATLVALNRLWGLRWSAGRLGELAVGLGMDVPFFLGRGRALATGRGERLEPLPGDGGYALVLTNPNFPLSTRESYGRVPAGWRSEATGTREVVAALRLRSAARLGTAADEPPRGRGGPGGAGDRADEGGAARGGGARRRDVRQRADRVRGGALAGPRPPDPPAGQPRRLVVLGGADPVGPRHPPGRTMTVVPSPC